MSKEDLARFKSADAKLLVAAQRPPQPPALLAEPGGRQRNEKSYRWNELCAFVAKCTNEYASQHGTGVDFYTMSVHILQSFELQFPKCNEKSYRRNELCAFVEKCTNEYANQHGTGVDFYTMSAHKLQSVELQIPV